MKFIRHVSTAMSDTLDFSLPQPKAPVRAHRGLRTAHAPKPYLHLAMFGLWGLAVAWFFPKLLGLLDLASSFPEWLAIGFFIVFIQIAWLYGVYNLCVVAFALIYQRTRSAPRTMDLPQPAPAVALLYTTCNDFVADSLHSCLDQDYPNFALYILDDSSDPDYRRMVDEFAVAHRDRVRVVRRPDRRGFKAGNLNHGLAEAGINEPFFALVDADEILPPDFLRRLVPRMLADTRCGYIQANHRHNPNNPSALARHMGPGIDSHWRWYQPLRNDYGFVMLLGHGALIRRQAWVDAGGFPELVSEDLAFALNVRKQGWHGRFAEDVVCLEDFPETVRAFRVRHMKWTRGTCEFLSKEMWGMLRSPNISWVEKVDVLIPTVNLPLSLLFFLFLVDTNLVLANYFGTYRVVTAELGGLSFTLPTLRLDPAFEVLNRADLFMITWLTLISPVLCFILDLWRTPVTLTRFLARSTALYGALGPLSSIGVAMFALTRRAVFHVTADQRSGETTGPAPAGNVWLRFRSGLRSFAERSHPDHWGVRGFELFCGLGCAWMAVNSFQIAFFGLALALVLFPVLHRARWENPWLQALLYVPLALVLLGLSLSGLALLGMQTMFFGFGFHF